MGTQHTTAVSRLAAAAAVPLLAVGTWGAYTVKASLLRDSQIELFLALPWSLQ
jgi:hypothetical protein